MVELGRADDVTVTTLSVLSAVVGLDLGLRAYAGGSPLRDQGHRKLLDRFRALSPRTAAWRIEVPLPIPGDQRAWDAMTDLWSLRVGIEAETVRSTSRRWREGWRSRSGTDASTG